MRLNRLPRLCRRPWSVRKVVLADLHTRLIWQLMLGEEADVAALYPQDVHLKVDTGLVGFEHVETKEEVDVAALNDGECASEEEVRADLHLGAMDTTEDTRGSDTLCNSAEAGVEQSHDTAKGGGVSATEAARCRGHATYPHCSAHSGLTAKQLARRQSTILTQARS